MRKITLVIVLLAGQLLLSCSDDDNDPGPVKRIDILPASTMLMEFETFAVDNGRQQSFGNAIRAGGHISLWEKYINDDLSMPVTAYLVSLDETAEYLDERWVWNSSFKLEDQQYSSSLSAVERESGIVWEMRISKPGTFNDFVAIRGQSSPDRKTGSWSMYKYPVDNAVALEITWKTNAEDKVNYLKYLSDTPQSFIEYTLTVESAYDGLYSLLTEGNAATIGWNRAKKNGWIIEQQYFQDNLRHCWNISFADEECE